MRKLVLLLLFIILISFITGCSNQENLGEILDLTKEDTVTDIKFVERPPTTDQLYKTLTLQQFQEVYISLIKTQCVNSKKVEEVTTLNGFDYKFIFNVEEKGGIIIILGQNYIIATSVKLGTFKCDIDEQAFISLKEIISRIE